LARFVIAYLTNLLKLFHDEAEKPKLQFLKSSYLKRVLTRAPKLIQIITRLINDSTYDKICRTRKKLTKTHIPLSHNFLS
jgi:hypothetical protein